jgi:hypothetical protein
MISRSDGQLIINITRCRDFASSLIPVVLLLTLAWCALYITLAGKPLGGWTEREAI